MKAISFKANNHCDNVINLQSYKKKKKYNTYKNFFKNKLIFNFKVKKEFKAVLLFAIIYLILFITSFTNTNTNSLFPQLDETYVDLMIKH